MLILYKYIFKSNNFSFKKKKEIIKLLLLHAIQAQCPRLTVILNGGGFARLRPLKRNVPV